MTTVYLVTSGTYSDYAIRGVFSTREKAELWRAGYSDPDSCIEEWGLDETFRGDRLYYKAIFQSDGSITSIESIDPDCSIPKNEEVAVGKFWNGVGLIFLAQDIAHARKHAPEIMAQFIAEGKVVVK